MCVSRASVFTQSRLPHTLKAQRVKSRTFSVPRTPRQRRRRPSRWETEFIGRRRVTMATFSWSLHRQNGYQRRVTCPRVGLAPHVHKHERPDVTRPHLLYKYSIFPGNAPPIPARGSRKPGDAYVSGGLICRSPRRPTG